MIRFSRLMLAAVAVAGLAAPALAQSTVIPPPYDGNSAPSVIVTEDQALNTLRARGVTHIERLAQVGDYWEGEGVVNGRRVVAYLFGNGALEVKAAAPGDRVPVPEQSAAAPE
ncbi:MAG TPA: hypothetical protein VGP48_10350 [Stellaceae bacterium]|jgi:hypothetical protein|nr:hypothetical protein [Stellaceae bacterium]